jgi:hypothetical protein
MPETLPERIHRDMTEAFDGRIEREVSPEARHALGDFIETAVVEGILKGLDYEVYREYLKCRFEFIAARINERVAPGATVTWDDIVDAGEAEVGAKNRECFFLLRLPGGLEGPDAAESTRKAAAAVCTGFSRSRITHP